MTTVLTFEELDQALEGRRSSLTIGVFDGVHLGHQSLVSRTVQSARQAGNASVVVTFKSHPLAVLAPPYTPRRLITSARKIDLLHRMGVDYVLLLEFSPELAATAPEAFVSEFLVRRAHIANFICGYDFTFGSRGSGNLDLLTRMGTELGFTVESLPAVSRENRLIKSTHIRDLLYAGHVSEAAALLSRPHELPGIVVSGMARGRTIGFPTANLQWAENFQVPAQGVYLCGARIGMEAEVRPAMVNIGTSPTFGENNVTVEAHLLDFQGELHGQPMALYFIERLRDERRFPGIDALVEQLNKDREISNALWKTEAIQAAAAQIATPVDHSEI